MKRLVPESTAPFQGPPELVAYDEGLFEKEGLDIEWVDRDAGAAFLRAFVEEVKASVLVAEAISRKGVQGVSVAPHAPQ
jgi:hypothetical protein